jgi:glycosyltransferase involved in cell wall biosynthesis
MRTLYSAFDLHPCSKGASTHISHFSHILASVSTSCTLFSLGARGAAAEQFENGICYKRFKAAIPNYLHRAEEFGRWLMLELEQSDGYELAHYRDVWSALAILGSGKVKATLFEVNGLPSIELPFRYPTISKQTLSKIAELENLALQQSDRIVVPAQQIRLCVEARGIDPKKIQVITNGADIPEPFTTRVDINSPYVMYFGALQRWQGVDDLLRAFNLLRDYPDLKLLICSSNPEKQARPYQKMIDKLDMGHRIIWRYELDKESLNHYIQQALLTVAPLKDCARNIQQGCCPLKVLESMANGTPVVGSAIAPIEEINAVNGAIKLCRPDRPADIARAMRVLIEFPAVRQELGEKSQGCIRQEYTWAHKSAQLVRVYQELCEPQPSDSAIA